MHGQKGLQPFLSVPEQFGAMYQRVDATPGDQSGGAKTVLPKAVYAGVEAEQHGDGLLSIQPERADKTAPRG
ncbi:hypothetical protein ACFSVK_16920 [Azorhizophilus paspali]|uniref:hypothetical protein n=1 Tax=Azorhizophilus paspali TaxID=69963 RepID=UPI0036420097